MIGSIGAAGEPATIAAYGSPFEAATLRLRNVAREINLAPLPGLSRRDLTDVAWPFG